jgi:hypothetical protein
MIWLRGLGSMRCSQRIAWLLGFFLIANIYLIPWFAKCPRATDLIGLLLGLALFVRFITRGLRPTPLNFLILLAVAPVLWGIYALDADDWLTVTRSARWLVALPWAYVLYVIARDSEARYALVQGMWWGVIVNLTVIVLQFLGQGALMQNLGLAAQDERLRTVYAILRLPGMHGDVGSSTAILSLIVPLSLSLFYKHGKSIRVVLIGLAVLATGTAMTLTRSPALVAVVTLAVAILFNLRFRRSFRLAASLLVVLIVGLVAFGPPGGWKRWTDMQNIQINASGRFYTNVLSLQLVTEHPLGVGAQQREDLVGATHNAFLQASLEYGLLFGAFVSFFVITMALRALWGLYRPFELECILALHMTGLFLFEEHLNNPTFIILTAWIAVSAIGWMRVALKRCLPKQQRRVLSHG